MYDPADGRDADEVGASAVEYALLAAFIAAVIITAVFVLSGQVIGLYERVNWWTD